MGFRHAFFVVTLVVFSLCSTAVEAQQRYVASRSVVNVLMNGGNYTTFGRQQCLKWETGGKALAAAESNPSHWADTFALDSRTNGTIAKDGSINECVAFVRMCSNAPGSGTWKKGPPAIFSTGIRNQLTQGTVLANFTSSGSYLGHCVVFAGWRSDGGMSVWDQNVGGRTIKWRSIPATGKGGFNDAKAYFVVETR